MEEAAMILKKIRDQYYDIQVLTMHCCSDIALEAIPAMIRQRTELMELISAEEMLLSDEAPESFETGAAIEIRAEIKSIITTIVTLDKQLETVIKNHMKRLQSDLAVLYKTSRAASAYAIHSHHG